MLYMDGTTACFSAGMRVLLVRSLPFRSTILISSHVSTSKQAMLYESKRRTDIELFFSSSSLEKVSKLAYCRVGKGGDETVEYL